MVPYSRITIDKIFYAFKKYITGRAKTHYEAALLLYCNNRHSFRFYYLRIISKIIPWTNFYLKKQEKIKEPTSGSVLVATAKKRWNTLEVLMKEQIFPDSDSFPLASAHVIFCSNKMGLGP